jgi:hypothetical protein
MNLEGAVISVGPFVALNQEGQRIKCTGSHCSAVNPNEQSSQGWPHFHAT